MQPTSLRILQTNFHRGWGGQPSRILMVSKALVERGHQLVIAAPAGSLLAVRSREAGLETFEEARFLKPKHVLSALADLSALRRLLRTRRFDLVDAHGSQDLWTVAGATALVADPPAFVFTRHNTKRVGDNLANRYLLRRRIDHLILASGSVLERYRPFLERGDLSPDRISVVHSSYREDRFHPGVDGAEIRKELDAVEKGALLVGVVGRLVPDKGGTYFLKAVSKLAPKFPSARFLFVGTGTEEERLRRETAALGLGDRVRFLGFRDDIPALTAALDLSVLPSVDCDASSAVLKEAMAVGRPVVATDIGGASEIVEHGRTGLIVPPADPDSLASAMAQILEREDSGRALGEAGARRVREQFGRDRMAEGTLEAYRRALQRRSLRSAGGR
ncbi:MAG TPA: glycosyltransferase family 4 protein [Candidatus Polarisedimenticolia bacterium]|nr:glycosyltransferase family 4 protein [Candidatus Polarisedimenticolia bacterium]